MSNTGFLRDSTGKILELNPKSGAEPSLCLWAFRDSIVKDLSFDPQEWSWPREGLLKATHFFDYSCKKGYRIILKSQNKQLGFDKWLEHRGYNFGQRREFFARLWHNWIPRKISGMVWLTIAEGLPIGE